MNENNTSMEKMKVIVDSCRQESQSQFRTHASSILTKGYIINSLKNRNAVNRKPDKEALVDTICYELNCSCQKVLEEQKMVFDKQVQGKDREKKQTGENVSISKDSGDLDGVVRPDIIVSAIDKQLICASVGAGGITFGSLAIWAFVVARGSNLGAYILITKLVSFIRDLGISLGGTAKVTHTVAVIGGPVVLGLIVALIIAGLVLVVMMLTWRERFAWWILQQLQTHNIVQDYEKQIDTFWEQIEKESLLEMELYELAEAVKVDKDARNGTGNNNFQKSENTMKKHLQN